MRIIENPDQKKMWRGEVKFELLYCMVINPAHLETAWQVCQNQDNKLFLSQGGDLLAKILVADEAKWFWRDCRACTVLLAGHGSSLSLSFHEKKHQPT